MKKLTFNITLVLIIISIFGVSLYSKELKVHIDEFTGEKTLSGNGYHIDEFTGEKTLHGKWKKIIFSMEQEVGMYTRFLYVDEQIILECAFLPNIPNFLINSGQLLNLKFDNDQIISLTVMKTSELQKGADIGDFFADQMTAIRVEYTFQSQDDEELLLDNLVYFVRVNNTILNTKETGFFTFSLKPGNGKALRKIYTAFKNDLDKLLEKEIPAKE